MLAGKFKKEPGDKYSVVLDLARSIFGVDYVATSQITASLKDDADDDQTSTVIDKAGSPPSADLVSGVATGGSTTTLIASGTDFRALGVKEGQDIVDVTQNWRAKIKLISSTDGPNDTLTFCEAVLSAVEVDDVFKVLIAKIPLKGGVASEEYRLTYLLTTNLGQVLEDTLYMTIDDK